MKKRAMFRVKDSTGILGNFGSMSKNFLGFPDGIELRMGMNCCIASERRKLDGKQMFLGDYTALIIISAISANTKESRIQSRRESWECHIYHPGEGEQYFPL